MPKILVTGNIVDGVEFHGPFKDREEAVTYAQDYHHGGYQIAPITPVKKSDEPFDISSVGVHPHESNLPMIPFRELPEEPSKTLIFGVTSTSFYWMSHSGITSGSTAWPEYAEILGRLLNLNHPNVKTNQPH